MHERVESFGGGDFTENSVSNYYGVIVALSGPLSDEGWRLRLAGGTGQYAYQSSRLFEALPGSTFGMNDALFKVDFAAETLFGEAMLGYQLNYAALWIKIYGGVHYQDHEISLASVAPLGVYASPVDPGDFKIRNGDPANAMEGESAGAKGVIEIWAPLGRAGWAGFDGSFSTANADYAASLRLGALLPELGGKWPSITAGPEAAIFGAQDYDAMRAGGFLRLNKEGYEVTLSGGVSGSYENPSGAYGSVGFHRKF